MRRSMLLLLAFASPLAVAGTGVGELSLDRGAVAAIVSANLPRTIQLAVPGMGNVSIRMSPPDSVRFVDGGVDVLLGLFVDAVGLQGEAALRYVPEIDEKSGIVKFRTVKATLGGALGGLPDLAGFFPALELPRSFDWAAEGNSSAASRMTVAVQGVAIEKERLVVRLGLVTRPLSKPAGAGPAKGK